MFTFVDEPGCREFARYGRMALCSCYCNRLNKTSNTHQNDAQSGIHCSNAARVCSVKQIDTNHCEFVVFNRFARCHIAIYSHIYALSYDRQKVYCIIFTFVYILQIPRCSRATIPVHDPQVEYNDAISDYIVCN
jgi:hypothetical protein